MAALVATGWLAAKYTLAAYHYQAAMTAAGQRDFATAERHMSRAAKLVPRSREFRRYSHFLRGLHHMQKQRHAEAVRELAQVAGEFRDDAYFREMYAVARLNHAWFSYDYLSYLARAEELHALLPEDDPRKFLFVAAGNAYRYAQTGREDFRRKSEEYLAQLEKMEKDESIEERMGRVRRCLETRVIPPH